jgi:hypothetical protein
LCQIARSQSGRSRFEIRREQAQHAAGGQHAAAFAEEGEAVGGGDLRDHLLGEDAFDAGVGQVQRLADVGDDVRREGRIDVDAEEAGDAPLAGAEAEFHLAALRSAIQRVMWVSSTASGTEPVASTASLKARRSKALPSSASARARSSEIFSWPIL